MATKKAESSTKTTKTTKAKTKKEKAVKPMKQLAIPEDCETIVRIDYIAKKIIVYSNKATIINRMDALGYKAKDIQYLDKKMYSKSYELPMSKITEILKGTIFKTT